jgi:hypothetical protein
VDRYPVRKPRPEFCAVNGNCGSFGYRRIPIRRCPFYSQLGRCLKRKGKNVSTIKQIQTEAKKRSPSRRKKRGLCQQDRPVVEPNAVGIDVGAREMYVAIPPDRDSEPVRVFKTFTADLEHLVDWLRAWITTVAMEPTGVYWIPLYQNARRSRRACVFGECASYEKRPRTTNRLVRVPMASIFACGWIAVSRISDRARRLRSTTNLTAASQRTGPIGGAAHAAHAQGTYANEHPHSPCHQ